MENNELNFFFKKEDVKKIFKKMEKENEDIFLKIKSLVKYTLKDNLSDKINDTFDVKVQIDSDVYDVLIALENNFNFQQLIIKEDYKKLFFELLKNNIIHLFIYLENLEDNIFNIPFILDYFYYFKIYSIEQINEEFIKENLAKEIAESIFILESILKSKEWSLKINDGCEICAFSEKRKQFIEYSDELEDDFYLFLNSLIDDFRKNVWKE